MRGSIDIYSKTIDFLATLFRELEQYVVPPTPIEVNGEFRLSYPEHAPQQVIIQKLARYISGLYACLPLLHHGFAQEIGVIFRTLDEFQEDIIFLSLPLTGSKSTALHEKYLELHFSEVPDIPENATFSAPNPATLPRKRIQSFLAESSSTGLNPHDGRDVTRAIHQGFSGYVHGSMQTVFEMAAGNPPRYIVKGMPGTQRQTEFINAYWNYAYRGILCVLCAAKALGAEDVANNCTSFRDVFEEATGETGMGDPEKLLATLKKKKRTGR